MAGNNSSKKTPRFNHSAAAHQPFSWLTDDAKDYPLADFIALTRDISSGAHTCLEIYNASALVREENCDALPGEEVLPAVTRVDAENLLRLAIGTSQLLHESAEQTLAWLNEYGARHVQAMKDAAE